MDQTNEGREADRGAKTHTQTEGTHCKERDPDNVDRVCIMARDKTCFFSLSCYIQKTDLLGFRNLRARTHTHTQSGTPSEA